MPLNEIKTYIENRSPHKLLEIFEKEEAIISQKIKHLKKTKEWLKKKSMNIKNALSVDLNNITIQSEPEKYLIQSEVGDADDKIWTTAIVNLVDYCAANEIKSPYPIGYRQSIDDLRKGIFHSYHVFYVLLDYKPKNIEYSVRPAGDYIVSYHKGTWQTWEKTYRRILEFSDAHDLKPGKYFYEDCIIDSLAVKRQEDCITRISCRLEN